MLDWNGEANEVCNGLEIMSVSKRGQDGDGQRLRTQAGSDLSQESSNLVRQRGLPRRRFRYGSFARDRLARTYRVHSFAREEAARRFGVRLLPPAPHLLAVASVAIVVVDH